MPLSLPSGIQKVHAKIGTPAQWAEETDPLGYGELGVAQLDGVTSALYVGDGLTPANELENLLEGEGGGISQEDLDAAIAAEAATRSSADSGLASDITAEETARIAADASEASARASADTSEATARAAADTAEATARASADSSEASTRASADSALSASISSEASTRASADSAEASTRAAADSALSSSLSTLSSSLDDEIATRAGNDAAHAALTSGAHGISAFGATLIDDAAASNARTTLGLGNSATKDTGTGSGQVAAGDHTHAQLHDAATVADSDTIDFTLSGQQITAQRKALTGDVTADAGSNATTIANDAVSNAKLANAAANTAKSNITASSADPADNSLAAVDARRSLILPGWFSDFLGTGASGQNSYGAAPFDHAVIASGTVASTLSGVEDSDHPGQVNILASTSNNSGARYITANTAFNVKGGECFECEFLFDLLTNTTAYFGYHDTANVSAPTDAAMIRVVGTTLDGICYGSTSSTATGTTYTITTGVWYRMRVEFDSAGTTVTFTLTQCNNGSQLWTNTVTGGNVPAGTEAFGCGAVVTNNGLSATSIGHLDYMRHDQTVALTR